MRKIFEEQKFRKDTMSRKWDGLKQYFGTDDALPFWVADMDFEASNEIHKAFTERIEHGIYGYVTPEEKCYQSIEKWFLRRHQWQIPQESIIFSPGVLAGISMTLEAFSEVNSGVVIQSPVYPSFAEIIQKMGRRLIENQLYEADGGIYRMNLEELEDIFKKESPEWLIFCNPHNPVGRVWSKEELVDLAKLCAKYHVKVMSDEIHGDLALGANRYIPFASIAEPLGVTVFTGFAASKAFNVAGLTTSFWIVQDTDMKNKLWGAFEKYKITEPNLFGIIALQTCYDKCEFWLDELKEYLFSNAYYVNEMINYHAPGMKANFPEGTFLSWLDCREMGLSQEELKRFFIDEAKIALSDGRSFGRAGDGFMRLNFGCSRVQLREGLERIVAAARSKRGWKL